MAFCTKCGAQVAEGIAFCGSCGSPMDAGGSAPNSSGAAPASGTSTNLGGLDANVAAALAYLWLVAILWLVIEPFNKDRFVRFHSFQALAFGVVSFIINIALGIIPFIGWIILVPVSLLILVGWLVCIFKAFNKEWFKLPLIGDWAMKQAG